MTCRELDSLIRRMTTKQIKAMLKALKPEPVK